MNISRSLFSAKCWSECAFVFVRDGKLKAVLQMLIFRSPGGTPVNKNPKPSATDPASIIAEALKRKFRNHVQHSPDVDKENENHDFDSSDNSPKFKVTF